MSNDSLEFEGQVKSIQKTYYLVEMTDPIFKGRTVQATLSGKMRMNRIRVIVGDIVIVELNEYDINKGRIVYRKK